jgi:hypothetical protein
MMPPPVHLHRNSSRRRNLNVEQTKFEDLKAIMTFLETNTSGYVILKKHSYEDSCWRKERMASFWCKVTMARYELNMSCYIGATHSLAAT